MVSDTQPVPLDDNPSGVDAWAEFRVLHEPERQRLLRALRDGNVPVMLNTPDGRGITVSLWAIDSDRERLNFSVDEGLPQLPGVIDADEVVAVAYLESVKLQFDLQGLMLVRSLNATALQCALPRDIYRFQRRNAYRVRPRDRHHPTAHLRHPALPEMPLSLRVLDISIGGCALWLPQDVPPLQAGTLFGEVQVLLDAETRIVGSLRLQHVSAQGSGGVRLGCEWQALGGSADRALQRWIDRTQHRHRLLTLG